jgi:hypothetical protein
LLVKAVIIFFTMAQQIVNRVLAEFPDIQVPNGPNIHENILPPNMIQSFVHVCIVKDKLAEYQYRDLTADEVNQIRAYFEFIMAVFYELWDIANPPNENGLQRQPGINMWYYQGNLL